MECMLSNTRNTELYVASRSVFMLAQTYLPRRVADVFGRTNNGNTPLSAILLCSLFGFVSLAGLSRNAHDQVIISYVGLRWCAMSLSLGHA